jgi:NADH-quinone oxidoreductase subunit M
LDCYLSLIVFLPFLGAILIAAIPGLSDKSIKSMALLFTFIPFALAIYLFAIFDRSATGMQFVEKVAWIPAINANYHLGVDGLSLPLVLLTTFLGFLCIPISWTVHERPREYFAWLLVLIGSIIGVFVSLDLLLFFLFWEIEVVPMYFLISMWGSGKREYSALKYVLYTLFGSAFMMAGILSVYFTTGSLSMLDIAVAGISSTAIVPAVAMFFLLFAAFAIKLPIFPLHTWLPDAHTDAPTAVSVMLAGSLLKMGGYGMIRICVTIFPDVARQFAPLLVIIAVVGVVYGAALTMRQTDLKRLIAYSSVSHMGFVLLGIFALTEISVTGAALQMVSHGVVTGLMFAMAGLLIHNLHERDLSKLGGLARQMPVAAVIFSIGGLASLGLPLTSGFVAEVMVYIGSFSSTVFPGMQAATVVAVSGVVLAAGYILWMIMRTFYGPVKEQYDNVLDAGKVDMVYMYPLVVVIIFIGIYPAILTDVIQIGLPALFS